MNVVVLLVFACFVALLTGAALIGFIVFLVLLHRNLQRIGDVAERLHAAIKPMAESDVIPQAAAALKALAQQVPELMAHMAAQTTAFSAFAEFATGHRPAATELPPASPNPFVAKPAKIDDSGFIPPRSEPEIVTDEVKAQLRERGIVLDEETPPDVDQVVQG